MKTDTDSVSLVVEAVDGRPLRAYRHDGKTYVESHETRSYQLRVKNKTGNRVKAVIAVDSLNILTGKPASDDPGETGYVLNPYAEEVFRGYRLDDNQVAAFTFVKREKSYATEAGEGQGNGVIAIRVYAEKEKKPDLVEVWRKKYEEERNRPREKEWIPYLVYPKYPDWHSPWYEKPYYRWSEIWCKSTDAVGNGDYPFTSSVGASSLQNCAIQANLSASADITASSVELKAQSFDMGSSWGDLVKETVTHTTFETGSLVAEIAVYYASLEGLKSMGIDVTRAKQVVLPEAFKRGYCAPPKGWISGKA